MNDLKVPSSWYYHVTQYFPYWICAIFSFSILFQHIVFFCVYLLITEISCSQINPQVLLFYYSSKHSCTKQSRTLNICSGVLGAGVKAEVCTGSPDNWFGRHCSENECQIKPLFFYTHSLMYYLLFITQCCWMLHYDRSEMVNCL